ncbi:MAG TPA: alpha/beta fold hydrolase [Anaerolineae bacterium]|nr:alpha/beta fold hydrolase [Anaerolineae bacterium]
MPDDIFPWTGASQPLRASGFQLELYRPAFGLNNAHVQTLLATRLPRGRGISFQRVRIDTPDGDFLDLDLPQVRGIQLRPDAPVVLFLHGLEGNARRPYALDLYRQLAQRGIRSVGMNYRSCSGEMNRTARSYHAGATDDVALAHDWLDQRFPGVAKGMAGVSLGGNMLLKYLGERGGEMAIRLRTAAAISPPFDLKLGGEHMEQGIGPRYVAHFLASIKAKLQAKTALVAPLIDLEAALAAQTLRQIDEAMTAPLHGFASADDYYARSSSRRYLPGVQVPTLILRAQDDPLLPASDIPYDLFKYNLALFPGITERGGHVGWVEGWPLAYSLWAQRQAADFLASYLR